ncbi:MAG TPA: hypothetical protein VMD07_10775 [Candidatus Acidoferrales bacterium]|nr:hypothetical protein [Candidatus Acidoferrales bacterium]
MIFLITYDTTKGALLEFREFTEEDREEAMRALKAAQEARLSELETVEIALFEAPSKSTLEGTHSRYFRTVTELGEDLNAAGRRGA